MKEMKRILVVVLFLIGPGLGFSARAQASEIAQLLLNVEKLSQLKGILEDLKKSYTILQTGYSAIKNISEGNFAIHKVFLDGLMEVSPAVKQYRKVAYIIDYQLQLVGEYKQALRQFRQWKSFTPDELVYISDVYENLVKLSLQNLDELVNVVTAGKLRMSDDERLKAIDRIFAEMEDKVQFLREFNNETAILAMQRAREQDELSGLRKMHEK